VDEASIEASERAITDFLMDFKAHYGAEKVRVLAHSMGNRGLLHALQRIAAQAQTLGRVQFSQIFLAAPDVDRDLFLDLARLYPDTPSALRCMPLMAICRCISPRGCTTRRAADTTYPTPWLPVLTRWPRQTSTSICWATRTAAQAEALLHEIVDIMRHNEAPAQRQRITPAVYEGTDLWRLRR
jgi:hypothetical protein